jgi:hypothetical protein
MPSKPLEVLKKGVGVSRKEIKAQKKLSRGS